MRRAVISLDLAAKAALATLLIVAALGRDLPPFAKDDTGWRLAFYPLAVVLVRACGGSRAVSARLRTDIRSWRTSC